jgi:hypothetical protein
VKHSAIGGHEAIFPRQHAESEAYIQSCGVPYTFLRPNGFMQNMVNYNAPTMNKQNAFYGNERRPSQPDRYCAPSSTLLRKVKVLLVLE